MVKFNLNQDPKENKERIPRKKILDTTVNIILSEKIGMIEFSENGFVRITIQAVGEATPGEKLYIFDHRPGTLELGRAIHYAETYVKGSWWDRVLNVKNNLGIGSFCEIINQPARAMVLEKQSRKVQIPYINLYATGTDPEASLIEMIFLANASENTGHLIHEGTPLWYWQSKSYSQALDTSETAYLAITDDDNRLVIDSWGLRNMRYAKSPRSTGRTNLTIAGLEIKHLSQKDKA